MTAEVETVENAAAVKPLRLKVSQAPGPQWGPDSHAPTQIKTLPARAERMLALAQLRARQLYPGRQITGEVTEDYTETILYGSPADDIVPLMEWVEQWVDADALYRDDFDAEAFFNSQA